MVAALPVQSSGVALIAAIALFLASSVQVVTTERFMDSSPHGWCSVDIRFPKVTGLKSVAIEHSVNRRLREPFFRFPEPYMRGVSFANSPDTHPSLSGCERDLAEETKSLPASHLYLENGHMSTTASTTFRVGHADNGFVSIVGDGFQYATPSAHPNDYWWTLNIDATTGRVMKFDDLFYSDATRIGRLRSLIEQSIRKIPYSSEYELVQSFDAFGNFPDQIHPLVCAGGVRFFSLFIGHAVAGVTTFVSGKQLIASGVVKDPLALAVLKEPHRPSDSCGD